MSPGQRKILLEAFVILLLGVMIGLTVNHRRLQAILEEAPSPSAQLAAGAPDGFPEPVGLAELRGLLEAGALAVDARTAELYAAGHLPGAVSLPLAEAQGATAALAQRLPAGRTLVTYCSGYGCNDSFELAVLLLRSGFRGVRVYEGGVPEWQAAGQPLVTEGR